jgi:hypothetical protein
MDTEAIRTLLQEKKIATMPELKAVLGTEVDMTVFRKLQPLGYRTSYSHRGKFYTLDEVAEFDDAGLWSVDGVRFSKHGTLVRTCEVLVSESERGWLVSELESRLGVRVGDALRKLVREDRIAREDAGGRALYVSADGRQGRRQLRRRASEPQESAPSFAAVEGDDELKAAIVLFCALLDEKQRRLFAGLESLKLGAGGDRRIADLLGLDPATVRRGRQELLSRDFEQNRVRKPGGGRKRVEKKRRR